jgi:hypothetical protein
LRDASTGEVFSCGRRQRGAGREVELAVRVMDVGLHRCDADEELLGDLRDRESDTEEAGRGPRASTARLTRAGSDLNQ